MHTSVRISCLHISGDVQYTSLVSSLCICFNASLMDVEPKKIHLGHNSLFSSPDHGEGLRPIPDVKNLLMAPIFPHEGKIYPREACQVVQGISHSSWIQEDSYISQGTCFSSLTMVKAPQNNLWCEKFHNGAHIPLKAKDPWERTFVAAQGLVYGGWTQEASFRA